MQWGPGVWNPKRNIKFLIISRVSKKKKHMLMQSDCRLHLFLITSRSCQNPRLQGHQMRDFYHDWILHSETMHNIHMPMAQISHLCTIAHCMACDALPPAARQLCWNSQSVPMLCTRHNVHPLWKVCGLLRAFSMYVVWLSGAVLIALRNCRW